MTQILAINHVTLIADDLDETCAFYENEFGLEKLPAYNFDYPAQFYRINETQQLHITEFPDKPSFRGHLCVRVDDFMRTFQRMKALDAIDTRALGARAAAARRRDADVCARPVE